MKVNVRHRNHCFRLLAGWSGLLLYVGVFSPIGMVVVASLGTIDPDHHALFQPGAAGMRLVLHHEGNGSEHHHGAVARALTIFTQPASNTDPDHVLQFSATNGYTRESQLVIPVANQSGAIAVVFTESFTFVPTRPLRFIPPPRPPPGNGEELLALCSTVLLI